MTRTCRERKPGSNAEPDLAAAVIRRHGTRFALLAGGLALLAACGSAPTTPAPAGTPGTPGGSSATMVTVTMTEFQLALSQQAFSPGTYTFVAKNSGGTLHALEIDGPGVSGQRTPGVPPGKSANLTVTLTNGKYQIYCPIDGHRGMGMEMMINVGSGAGSAPSSAPVAPTTASGGGSGGGYGY